MNGYLTRLAARSLDRTDMIGPRPISRFEEPRHTVALYGERLGEREGTAIESSPNQELYHAAVEQQVRQDLARRHSPPGRCAVHETGVAPEIQRRE